jgi:hypothetical protein
MCGDYIVTAADGLLWRSEREVTAVDRPELPLGDHRRRISKVADC